MNHQQHTEIKALAFDKLLAHIGSRPDVQNIDLMNLAGFCRNCLARWYQEAAAEQGREISQDAAREFVYGMPFSQWKAQHQTDASPSQLAQFSQQHTQHQEAQS